MYPVHRRNLPHIIPAAIPIFFTWRLYGSLPANKSFCRDAATGAEFRAADTNLAKCATGPKWLCNPEIATMVAEEIKSTADRFNRYRLLEFVVMPNHVHLLVVPHGEPSKILRVLKGFTARRANLILGRTGSTFWQDETFDHYVRHLDHQIKIQNYIANDPVKCGLVSRPQEYRWSSAYVEK